jgi:hypothetical protein
LQTLTTLTYRSTRHTAAFIAAACAADIVEAQGLLQHVQQLLGQDGDPQVAANGLTLMMQVQGVKRLASNKALLYSLINRIKVSSKPSSFLTSKHSSSSRRSTAVAAGGAAS